MRLIKSSIVGIGIGLAGFTVGMGLANADVEWWDPFTWTAATSTPADNAFNNFFDTLLPTSSTLGSDISGVGTQVGDGVTGGSQTLGDTTSYLGDVLGGATSTATGDIVGNGDDLGATLGTLVQELGALLNPEALGF
ncbi:MAG TPA: hypothetical protein VFR17_04970 [Mycobacterium sp.]|nr:hypothetical protein [Mycobacterium sp.]